MNKSDLEVYRDVQKNAERGMKLIDALQDKIYDRDMASLLIRQNMQYEKIRNKAVNKIVNAHSDTYHASVWSDFLIKGPIQVNTLFNTSTSHIAALMIQANSKGLVNMWKTLNMHGRLAKEAVEFADEMIQLEEKNIRILREYL